jgi:hypothetical protein
MTKKTNQNTDDLEKLREENELKKMKMILEHGAFFSEPSEESSLHPAIEEKFLNNVEKFDEAFNNCKQISLFDFLDKPEFRKTEEISEIEIGPELDRITKLMNENGISLDTLCEVDNRELYRFITEELFLHEMDDIRIEGMMHCFIYEEFHPNHEYDIRNHCHDFIRYFLKKDTEWYKNCLTPEAEKNNWFENFRDAYRKFSLKHFDIKSVDFDEEHAHVVFEIQFSAYPEEGNKAMKFSGDGTIELSLIYDYWCIDSVNFPMNSDLPASASL